MVNLELLFSSVLATLFLKNRMNITLSLQYKKTLNSSGEIIVWTSVGVLLFNIISLD